ncbi:MAG: HIT family protein [Phycisphaerae bacterium]|nr:HIT family protein [Phycisphaerae bacterium]
MTCPLCAELGRDDRLLTVARLGRSRVFLNDKQGCRGWCVLVLNRHVEHLDELTTDEQRAVFGEVAIVARAVREVCRGDLGPPRINYECLGNQVGHVHWHVIPRHADDPDPRNPVWGWPADRLAGNIGAAERAALAARLNESVRELAGGG